MAEDDDNLNDFTLPPHSNEDADTQLDAKALKMVREYVSSLNRSKNENTIRGGIRDNIVKLGINSLSFQHELTAAKMMTPEDRRDYMSGRRRMGRILAIDPTMFSEEQERVKQRKAKAKEKAAKAAAAAGKETPEQQERRIAADTNPRSDPKRGGAGKKAKPVKQSAADRAEATGERNKRLAEVKDASPGATIAAGAKASDTALAESIKSVTEAEQVTGAALLDTTPKSQSQISQEKLEAAKLA